MDIKDLKKAWNQVSEDRTAKAELTEERIRELLSSRTENLMERIDKNIRIGFAILFVIIVSIIICDFIVVKNPDSVSGSTIPFWVTILDRVINLMIFIVFLIFVLRYRQIRKKCEVVCNLRQALEKVIEIFTTYNRLFVFVLIIFLLASASGYIAGFYKGINFENPQGAFLPVAIISGIVTLALFTGLLFLIIRWIFRKMYGKYLDRLKETLKELDELD